jgi:pimeloyl-ACP methyl ester carboxylesterase
LRAIVRELDAGTGEHLRSDRLRTLRAPVRWLVGEWSDRAFAAAAERAKRMIPNLAVTRVERSGHFIQWHSPQAVVRAVEQVAPQPG